MKKKLKAQNFYCFKSLAEPQLSPNKQSFIYLQRKVAADKQRYTTAIFLKSKNNINSTQLTEFKMNALNARFSLCSKYISFTYNDKKENYISIYNILAKSYNNFKTSLFISNAPIWSNNSDSLVFTAIDKGHETLNSYQGAPCLTESNLLNKNINVVTDIDYKNDGIGYNTSAKNKIYLAKLKNNEIKDLKEITLGNFNYYNPIFSKNNNYVYAVKQVKDKDNLFLEYLLVKINLKTKEEHVLIKNTGLMSQLQLSPDSLEISFVAISSDEQYYNSRLYMCSINEQNATLDQLTDLTKGLDRNIGELPASEIRFYSKTLKYKWLSNGNAFTILFANKGASVLAEINKVTNQVKILYYNNNQSISAFSRVDNDILLLLGDSEKPECIYEYKNNDLIELINANEWLNDYNIGKTTKFIYSGADDEQIDGWYVVPRYYTQKMMPTILLIHGGPQGMYGSAFMFLAQLYVANGFAVIFTNPRGSLSYGLDFAQKVLNDWANNDYIDIMKGVQYLINIGIADAKKLGVTGLSYGGYMTNMITTKTNRFKAAVSGASVTNLHSMYGTCDKGHNFLEHQLNANPWSNGLKLLYYSPLNYVDKINTPILLLHGESDLRCPIAQSEQLFVALKRQNKKTVFVRYKNQYHLFTNPSLVVDYFLRSVAWMKEYII